MLSAAFTGTVLFSTGCLAISAIFLAADSTNFKSGARPFPTPNVFVGVLTEMKIKSASIIAVSVSVVKKRFFSANFFNNFLEAWFVYGESVRVPGIDTRLTEIHHCHLGGREKCIYLDRGVRHEQKSRTL